MNNQDMISVGNIYGENVSKKIVDGVLSHLDPETGFYMREERRLGFTSFTQ